MWLLFLFQVSERKGRVASSKVRPRNWNVHVSNELHHPWKLFIGRLLEDADVFLWTSRKRPINLQFCTLRLGEIASMLQYVPRFEYYAGV